MSDPVIHAFHKLGIFLVKSGLVWVPIARLGSWLCGTTKLLWRHLRVQGRLSFCYPRFVYMNQVPDCRQSCVVTLLVFVLPDGVWLLSHPSHRIDLAGHQQKCQSHLIPHTLLPHALELCSSSLSSNLFNSPKPCVSAFGTGNSCNSSTTMQLKNKSELLSNCGFQISRLSNQNRLNLCHDPPWFSGDVCIFSHPASATTWKRVSELTGTQSFPTPSHSSSLATAPASPLCFSWHSFVRWCAMFVLDYEILGMRSLRVFQLSFAHALTYRASLVAASPGRGWTPLHRAAQEGHVEVVALLLKSGASLEVEDDIGRRPQSCRSHGNCVGEESGCLLLPSTFSICPSGSFSCLCMTWCFWYRHQWQVWFDELLVLLSCVFFDESAKAGLSVRSL